MQMMPKGLCLWNGHTLFTFCQEKSVIFWFGVNCVEIQSTRTYIFQKKSTLSKESQNKISIFSVSNNEYCLLCCGWPELDKNHTQIFNRFFEINIGRDAAISRNLAISTKAFPCDSNENKYLLKSN